MKKKALIYFAITGALIVLLLLYVNVFSKSYYQLIPVQFNQTNTPLIEVNIEEHSYPISFNTGSKFKLKLNKEILNNIAKKKNGVAKWYNLKGNYYESISCIIPQIKIEKLILNKVVTIETREDCNSDNILYQGTRPEFDYTKELGSIGKPLLKKFNLLLDFKNSRIIASDNIEKLKKSGIDIKKMVKIPLEKGHEIILKVDTDMGIKKFGLITGSTVNLIKTSIPENKEYEIGYCGLKKYVTSTLILGKRDFGKTIFYLFDINPMLNEIDGILGMDFLMRHLIYIDYKNKVAYIGDSQPNDWPFS
jgi:hypothetical protein